MVARILHVIYKECIKLAPVQARKHNKNAELSLRTVMGVVWSSPHLIVWSLHILNFGCLDHQERFCAQYLSFPQMGHRHDDSSSHSTEAGRVLGAASICWLRGRTIIDKWVSRLFFFLNEATYHILQYETPMHRDAISCHMMFTVQSDMTFTT